MPTLIGTGVSEGIFTTWTKLWETTDTDLGNFNGSGSTYTPNSGIAVFIDESDSQLLIANTSQQPRILVQDLTTGKFLYSSGKFTFGTVNTLSIVTSAFDFVNTFRSKYLVLIGDGTTGARSANKFSVLKAAAILFTSGDVVPAGDNSSSGIYLAVISATGKYIAVMFFDNTTGLAHLQLWSGS